MTDQIDLVLINPGGRKRLYQNLGTDLTAVEPPLWCRLIAGYARDHGYIVRLVDSEAEEIGPDEVSERIKAMNPRLVGLVVFGHQPSASTQQMAPANETARAIKNRTPEIPIIILGGHVSALPERTLREEPVDFACKGEGPSTVVQLLAALKSKADDLAGVQGLVWWNAKDVSVNSPAPLIKDLDHELHGNTWDLLPMDKYRAHNWQCFKNLEKRQPYASIYPSLGCPYKCAFCCINAPFDSNRYRMRSPEKVVAEVDYLSSHYGIETFKIIDEMFVLNERHVTAICQGLADLNRPLNIWAYARIDTIQSHQLKLLRDGGIQWLALGIESGSKHVREESQKALNSKDIVNIVGDIQKAGISVIGNFIFGLPDDNFETMGETLELAKELNCEFANFYSAMAYPGSPLYLEAESSGLPLPENWSGYSQHSFDCHPMPTNALSSAEVLAFRDNAFHEYFENPRYLDMITQRFGWQTRRHIEKMSKHRLTRKIIEQHIPESDNKDS